MASMATPRRHAGPDDGSELALNALRMGLKVALWPAWLVAAVAAWPFRWLPNGWIGPAVGAVLAALVVWRRYGGPFPGDPLPADEAAQNEVTRAVLGQDGETIGPVAELFRLSDAERTDLLAADKGEGLLIGRASRRFIRVTASPEEHRLITTDPAELRRIEAEERAARAAPTGTGD